MFKLLLGTLCILSLHAGASMNHFYDFEAKNIKGNAIAMSSYEGKVVLVVNVASECGFTSQYKGLEKLYQTYKAEGLEVIGFPCNQFGGQEPASEKEIQNFCSLNFAVTFPLFAKIDVNGMHTHPLYSFLKKEATGFLGTKNIKWNFTKFLIDKRGKVITRYGSSTKPKDIAKDIEKYLGKK
ncbi:MAG: glutathione peroxidase [Sulfurovum sp.]|nr:glutathione peroxidase [Sulfurovum sp.]